MIEISSLKYFLKQNTTNLIPPRGWKATEPALPRPPIIGPPLRTGAFVIGVVEVAVVDAVVVGFGAPEFASIPRVAALKFQKEKSEK